MDALSGSQSKFNYPKRLLDTSQVNKKPQLILDRPKPSPSKSQLMMKELGLDQVDDFKSETDSDSSVTFSDDDETLMKMIDGPTKAEHASLQKDRDNLLVRNKELSDDMRILSSRLQREELKYQRHIKILKKAQRDVMKDKDNLIVNLEDIIFENEMRIRELDDSLKGNPIKPTIEKMPQTSSVQKLIDNLKSFQNEKFGLNEKIINLEQNLEQKSSELQKLHENPIQKPDVPKTTISSLDDGFVKRLKEELSEVKIALEDRNKELVAERENKDLLSDELDRLEMKMKGMEKERKSNEKKMRLEMERLKSDLDKKSSDLIELENRPPVVVTKTVESVIEVESTQQQSEIGSAKDKIVNLEKVINDKDRLLRCRNDEISRLKNNLGSAEQEIQTVRAELDEKNSSHLEEEANLRCELRQKETELNKEKKNVEKGKKSLKSEKNKVSELEQELQELKASSKRARDEAMIDFNVLTNKMKLMETGLKEELRHAEKSSEIQKQDFESVIERLEKKVHRTEDNLLKARDFNRNLSEKMDSNAKKIESLHVEMESKENSITLLKSRNLELESQVTREKRKQDDLSHKLLMADNATKALQTQIQDLSGASDVATVELSALQRENATLKMNISTVESQNLAYQRDLADANKKQNEMSAHLESLENQIAALKASHASEVAQLSGRHSTEMEQVRVSVNSEIRVYSSKLHKMHYSLRHLLSSLRSISNENQHLKKECAQFPILIEESLRQAEKKILDSISDINENSKELIRRYKKEMMLRKKYHNELVELKGNIRVFARVRPAISEDGSGAQAKNTITYDRDDDGVMYVHNSQRGRSTLFELDKVFQPDSTQNQVFSEVQALVTSCIDGYHVCIFAYGQTGSGKTYTMEGTADNPGINQRALSDLFKDVQEKTGDWTYEITVSLIEIYNETLKDLLTSSSAHEKLDIKMNADGSLYVPGLTQKTVHNLEDVNNLFKLGRKNRATATTNMNEHSSRSHAVLMIYVNGINTTTGSKSFGKLNLIDLAGSERVSKSGASGDRLKEAQNINKSLSALGDVIQALGAKQSHVPFRNSKLTYLLQDSLSKDSKTLMVVQVAPVEKNVSETICSLSFAQRVRKVELGQANKKTDDESTPKKGNTPSSKNAHGRRK